MRPGLPYLCFFPGFTGLLAFAGFAALATLAAFAGFTDGRGGGLGEKAVLAGSGQQHRAAYRQARGEPFLGFRSSWNADQVGPEASVDGGTGADAGSLDEEGGVTDGSSSAPGDGGGSGGHGPGADAELDGLRA